MDLKRSRARMFYDSSQITSDNASSGVERCRRDVVPVICRCVAALQRQWRPGDGYGGGK